MRVSLRIAEELRVSAIITAAVTAGHLNYEVIRAVYPRHLLFRAATFIPGLRRVLEELVFVSAEARQVAVVLLICTMYAVFANGGVFHPLLAVDVVVLAGPRLNVRVGAGRRANYQSLYPASRAFFFQRYESAFFRFQLGRVVGLFYYALERSFVEDLLFHDS